MPTILDRKFQILRPTYDKLERLPLEVANAGLINPLSTSPLCLVDGELVQPNAVGKWQRATDAAAPSFFTVDWRGDQSVQGARKLSAVVGGGALVANTLIFDPTLTAVGTPYKYGNVTIDTLVRAGLIPQGGTGLILGYVMRPAAANGGLLQIFHTMS